MSWSADSRVAERIRERVAEVVLHELQDPRRAFVTITRVKLAKDKSTCIVYYSVFGSDGDRSKTGHMLNAAAGFIQREVAQALRTRTMPHLSFEFDPSVEGGIRMAQLLRGLAADRPPEPEPGAVDPEAPPPPDAAPGAEGAEPDAGPAGGEPR